MKARLVREELEHFERGGNPLRQMDIGMRGFDDLKRGDVIRCIKEAWVSENEDLIFYPKDTKSGYYWRIGNFGILKRDAVFQDEKLSLELIGMENLDRDIEETSDKIKNDPGYGKIFATVTGIQSPSIWMEFFKVVNPRKLRESLAFDRGGSPLKKLDIGIVTWEKLKPGNILQNRRTVYKASSSDGRLYFSNNEDLDDFEGPGKYYIVQTASEMDDSLSVTMYQSSIFRHAWNIADKIKEGMPLNMKECWANKSIEEWDAWFRIVQPNEYEKEFNKA